MIQISPLLLLTIFVQSVPVFLQSNRSIQLLCCFCWMVYCWAFSVWICEHWTLWVFVSHHSPFLQSHFGLLQQYWICLLGVPGNGIWVEDEKLKWCHVLVFQVKPGCWNYMKVLCNRITRANFLAVLEPGISFHCLILRNDGELILRNDQLLYSLSADNGCCSYHGVEFLSAGCWELPNVQIDLFWLHSLNCTALASRIDFLTLWFSAGWNCWCSHKVVKSKHERGWS